MLRSSSQDQIIAATEAAPAAQINAATKQDPQQTSEIKTVPNNEEINNAFMELMECFPDLDGLEPPIILPDQNLFSLDLEQIL